MDHQGSPKGTFSDYQVSLTSLWPEGKRFTPHTVPHISGGLTDKILEGSASSLFLSLTTAPFAKWGTPLLFYTTITSYQGFPVGTDDKESARNEGDLGWEYPLEKSLATHSSILAWRIPTDRGAWGATACGVTESDVTERLSTPLTLCPGAFSPTLPLAWIYGSWTPLHTSDLNPLQDITLLLALLTHSMSYHTPLPAQTNTTSPQSHQPASGKQLRSVVGRGQSIYTPEKAQ